MHFCVNYLKNSLWPVSNSHLPSPYLLYTSPSFPPFISLSLLVETPLFPCLVVIRFSIPHSHFFLSPGPVHSFPATSCLPCLPFPQFPISLTLPVFSAQWTLYITAVPLSLLNTVLCVVCYRWCSSSWQVRTAFTLSRLSRRTWCSRMMTFSVQW